MRKSDNKAITLLTADDSYRQWVQELKHRYILQRQKAAHAVNSSLLEYYWQLGHDIEARQYANTYGSAFFQRLSDDMRGEMPDTHGFSPINLRYMCKFYRLYACPQDNLPQTAEHSDSANVPQPAEQFITDEIFRIPWDHHRRIIDKCKGDTRRALFFVQKTIDNNWGRNALLAALDTDLYEREGNAVTNFHKVLPRPQSDLAQQMTKDPYMFDFLTMREDFDERELEDALVANVTRFLLELGKGFSYMGRQFRLNVGTQEFFPDLLFYNARIHAYVVIELKVQTFKPEYLGQLSFYVSAINHQFRTEQDNPTVGLLICKDKDNVVARYALDGYSQPLGISEFQLESLLPKDFKSSLPTIEEIEAKLTERMEAEAKK